MNCFPYPGNKARHADWILEHIPEHDCYVELFGGAAGVLFNKPRSKIEVYNDLNGDIPHFFRVLRDRGDELQEWLRNVPYSREVYEDWATAYYDGQRPDDDITRAGRFFTLRYMQFGGKIDGKAGFGTKTTDNPAGYLRNSVESLAKFRNRLRNVTIESTDWSEAFDRYDSPRTVFYIDPPYQDTESYYGSDSFAHKKLYQHVVDAESKCVISYDSIPTWYDGAFNVVAKDSTTYINEKGQTDTTEYLIMNYDSKGEPIMSEVGQQTLI